MFDDLTLHSDRVPKVTVALAVRNGGLLLERAVLSVLNQSFKDWELLLLDDGSTDGAIERLPFLSDNRIVAIHDFRNLGLAFRLNQAVCMAKGKYFARMDHDDICHPERFARQIAFLEERPEVDLLATQCLAIDEQGRFLGVLPSAVSHADICRHPWQGFYMAHPTWMGRTEWFRQNGYQDPAPYCCEDQELLLRAHYLSCFHTLPERLLAYRVRARTPWKKQFGTRVAMGKMQMHHFLEKGKFGNAVLSGMMGLARVLYDIWTKVIDWGSPSAKLGCQGRLSSTELQEWEVLLRKLNASTECRSDQ